MLISTGTARSPLWIRQTDRIRIRRQRTTGSALFRFEKAACIAVLHQKNTHALFLYKVLEQCIAELLIFHLAMDLAKHIDLSILIAEHFRNARTGGEVDFLRASRIKFKDKGTKDDERQCKSEKFPAQNNPSRKKRIHKTSCHYFYAWGLDCPHSGNEHGFSCHETGNCSFHATDCKFSAAILSAALC